jgi:hypothetical protein
MMTVLIVITGVVALATLLTQIFVLLLMQIGDALNHPLKPIVWVIIFLLLWCFAAEPKP